MKYYDGISSIIKNGEYIYNDYKITDFLGNGSFNNQYLAVKYNKKFFIKQYIYPVAKHKSFKKFIGNQKKIHLYLSKLNSDLIKKTIEVFEFQGYHFQIKNYYENAILLNDFISSNPKIIKRFEIVKQIIDSIYTIYSHKIVHTDLKPSQFLLIENKNIKLLDFDHVIIEKLNISSPGFTHNWHSPEHITNKNISYHSDIFTLGMIIYKTLTNIHPFYKEIQKRNYEKAILNKLSYTPINEIYKNTLPKTVADTIDSMMEPDYKNRPSIVEIKSVFLTYL